MDDSFNHNQDSQQLFVNRSPLAVVFARNVTQFPNNRAYFSRFSLVRAKKMWSNLKNATLFYLALGLIVIASVVCLKIYVDKRDSQDPSADKLSGLESMTNRATTRTSPQISNTSEAIGDSRKRTTSFSSTMIHSDTTSLSIENDQNRPRISTKNNTVTRLKESKTEPHTKPIDTSTITASVSSAEPPTTGRVSTEDTSIHKKSVEDSSATKLQIPGRTTIFTTTGSGDVSAGLDSAEDSEAVLESHASEEEKVQEMNPGMGK